MDKDLAMNDTVDGINNFNWILKWHTCRHCQTIWGMARSSSAAGVGWFCCRIIERQRTKC